MLSNTSDMRSNYVRKQLRYNKLLPAAAAAEACWSGRLIENGRRRVTTSFKEHLGLISRFIGDGGAFRRSRSPVASADNIHLWVRRRGQIYLTLARCLVNTSFKRAPVTSGNSGGIYWFIKKPSDSRKSSFNIAGTLRKTT